jgi:hypothetical protein
MINRVLPTGFYTFGIKESRAVTSYIMRIRVQNFSNDLIPRSVLFKGSAEVLLPLLIVASTLHQHDMKQLLHSHGIRWRSQQLINHLRAFVGVVVLQKATRFFDVRSTARQIQPHAPQEFRIVRQRCWRLTGESGCDQLIDSRR